MDETADWLVGRASSRAGSDNRSSRCESALIGWSGLTSAVTKRLRQFQSNFVAFGELAEEDVLSFNSLRQRNASGVLRKRQTTIPPTLQRNVRAKPLILMPLAEENPALHQQPATDHKDADALPEPSP